MDKNDQSGVVKKLFIAAYCSLVVVAAAALCFAVYTYSNSRTTEITSVDVDAAHNFLTLVMIAAALVSFFALLFVDAPYGRYQNAGWGFGINARLAWLTQEVPSLLVLLGLMMWQGLDGYLAHPLSPRSLLSTTLLLHYTYRSLIFPLLIRGGKPTPLYIWLMAFVFTSWNGFLQGWQLSLHTPEAEPLTPRVIAGLMLWALGLAINIHSDHVLRMLRKPGETGYKIPYGGMFTFVSGANFFGEILEWSGFALAAWSLPAAAFALNTFCNLAPRGVSHHRWYKQKFEDYPKTRKAVIPFLW